MELPDEIIDGILSHLRAEEQPYFRHLRLAFTCRAFYEEFHPSIAQSQRTILHQAMVSQHLDVDLKATGLTLTQARKEELLGCMFRDEPFSKIWGVEARVCRPVFQVTLGADNQRNVDVLDCLQSLFTRTHLRSNIRMRGFGVELGYDLEGWISGLGPHDRYECTRHFVRFLETILEYEGTDVSLDGMVLSGRKAVFPRGPDLQRLVAVDHSLAAAITNAPQNLPGLTTLTLRGLLLHPITHFPFAPVIRQLSATLTELTLGKVGSSLQDWDSLFRNWDFPTLSSLSLDDLPVTLQTVFSFMGRHRTIQRAFLLLHRSGALSSKTKIHLENLTTTPEILYSALCESLLTVQKLRELTIQQDERFEDRGYERPHPLSAITSILGVLHNAAPSLSTLSLGLTHTPNMITWIQQAEPPMPTFGRSLRTTITSLVGTSAKQNNNFSPLSNAIHSLKRVTDLRFSVHEPIWDFRRNGRPCWPPETWVDPSLVVSFVSAFPAVRSVFLERVFYREIAHADPNFWDYVARVWVMCPTLVKMEILGVLTLRLKVVWLKGSKEPVGGFRFKGFPPPPGY